jgi:Ca2+-binding EF-hand superfamily protein
MGITQTKEVFQMFTKLKVVLITAACLVGGVAGIAAADGGSRTFDRAAKKAEMLAKYDTNKNGVLDPAEKEAMHEARAEEMFKKLDKDGDGKLSLAEFKAAKGMRQGRGGKGRERGGFRGGRGGGSDRGPAEE